MDVLHDLEARVRRAPDGDPVFGVWADALIERSDPRGELVALSQRLQSCPSDATAAGALRALVREHAGTWCPGCVDESITLTWQNGFVDTLTYRPKHLEDFGYEAGDDSDSDAEELTAGAAVRRFVDLPLAARIRSISTCCPLDAEGNHGCWGSHESFVSSLLALERPHLRALELDATMLPQGIEHGAAQPQMSCLIDGIMHPAEITIGDLGRLWQIAPGIEHLVLAQAQTVCLGDIDAPQLRTLVIGADEDHAGRIASGRLPKLQTLLVRVRDAQQIEQLLGSASIGRIEHLGLICSSGAFDFNHLDDDAHQLDDDVIDALLRSKRVADLHTLDLGGLVASDKAWRKLAAAASRFSALTELRLSSWAFDETPIEDYMAETAELLATPERSPHTRPIGELLTAKLPVRWMLDGILPENAPEDGLFLGMYVASEGFAERRLTSPRLA